MEKSLEKVVRYGRTERSVRAPQGRGDLPASEIECASRFRECRGPIGGDDVRKMLDAAVRSDSENDRCMVELVYEDALLSVGEFARRFLEPFLFPEMWLDG